MDLTTVVTEARRSADTAIEVAISALDTERQRLVDVRTSLNGETAPAETPKPKAERRTNGVASRGRRKGQPSRQQQFLDVVRDNPGITVNDAAAKIGIKPNYLYRLAGTLKEDKAIRKQDKGFVLA